MSAKTPLQIDEFTFEVDLERGPVGTGTCICSLPSGRKIRPGVENALEHTRCNSRGVNTYVRSSKFHIVVPLSPKDDGEEVHKLHVVATAQGILAGVVDCLAESGLTLVVDSCPPIDLDQEHLEMVRALSS